MAPAWSQVKFFWASSNSCKLILLCFHKKRHKIYNKIFITKLNRRWICWCSERFEINLHCSILKWIANSMPAIHKCYTQILRLQGLVRSKCNISQIYTNIKLWLWQGSWVVETLSNDRTICSLTLCNGILLWRRALHLHLAPATHTSIMLLRSAK